MSGFDGYGTMRERLTAELGDRAVIGLQCENASAALVPDVAAVVVQRAQQGKRI